VAEPTVEEWADLASSIMKTCRDATQSARVFHDALERERETLAGMEKYVAALAVTDSVWRAGWQPFEGEGLELSTRLIRDVFAGIVGWPTLDVVWETAAEVLPSPAPDFPPPEGLGLVDSILGDTR
jgi:hypothetical protein